MNQLAAFLSEAEHTALGKHGGRKVVLQGKEYSMNQLVHKFANLLKDEAAHTKSSQKVYQKLRHLEQDQSYLEEVPANSKKRHLLKIRRTWGHFFDKLKYGCTFNRHKILDKFLLQVGENPVKVEKKDKLVEPKTSPKVSEKPKEKTKTTSVPSMTPTEEKPKRPSFSQFKMVHQERLNIACDKVEAELSRRSKEGKTFAIELGLKLGKDNQEMCDYLVKTNVIYAWASTTRLDLVFAKLTPDDHVESTGNLGMSTWRDLSIINKESDFQNKNKITLSEEQKEKAKKLPPKTQDNLDSVITALNIRTKHGPRSFGTEKLYAIQFLKTEGLIDAYTMGRNAFEVYVKPEDKPKDTPVSTTTAPAAPKKEDHPVSVTAAPTPTMTEDKPVSTTTAPAKTAEKPKRPSFELFTKSEQKQLNKICDLVEAEWESRSKGNPAQQIDTNFGLSDGGLSMDKYISTKMCDYLVEKNVIYGWNKEERTLRINVKLKDDDKKLTDAYFLSSWRDHPSIQLEQKVKLEFKRPDCIGFSAFEKERLNDVCNKIVDELISRAAGHPPKDINLDLQWDAPKGLSSKMCDYLVEQGAIHAWQLKYRGDKVVVQLSAEDERCDHDELSHWGWRDLAQIKLKPPFQN